MTNCKNNIPAINIPAGEKIGKVYMPITFKAPVTLNLAYNGKPKPFTKLTGADLARYIADALTSQGKTVPCSNVPAPDRPSHVNEDCTRIDIPIRDRDEKECCNAPTGKCCNAPSDKPIKPSAKCNLPTDKPGNIPEEWKHVEINDGLSESEIVERIKDEIVRRFACRREALVSVTPFPSCYNMYAVGTTGDVTFVVWKHRDGHYHIQRQIW